MKKNSIIICILFTLIVMVSTGITFFYLQGRQSTPPNSLVIEREGKNTVVDFSTLSLESFSGTVVNGKGQSKEVSGQGIRIDKLIGDSGFTEARVVADDEYNAVVKPADTANAWIQIESGKARLIVFGDSDSKRAVKNVVRIEVK